MVSALKVCFTLLTMLALSFLPKDALAEWIGDLIPPSCAISFNPTGSTNIGNSVNVTVNANDGAGSGVANITLKKAGVDVQTVPNSNTLTYSWNTNNQATGSYTFSVTASDVAGNKRESACTNVFNLTSAPPPPPALSVSCSAFPNPAQTNYVVTWTANPTGGTGTYSYVWSITDGWDGYGKQIYTTHSNGQKTANLTVRSGAQSKTATCAVIVNPPPKKPPQSFNINSRTTTSSCEAGRPYINLAWTQSTNALTYYVYRQRWDTSRSQWITEHVGTSYGSLSYKDFGIEQSNPYYYYVIAYGVDDPPAWSGWSDIIYSPNCNENPADFSINPSPPRDFCANSIPPFPIMSVNWERPAGTTAAWYNIYRYIVNTNQYEYVGWAPDPVTIFYDFNITSGYKYTYAIVAVNTKAYPGFKLANNSFQDQTKPVRKCIAPPPTVDLKVNGSDGPINVADNSSASLSWTTTNNPTSCLATYSWIGSKSTTVGSETVGPLSGGTSGNSYRYDLTCTNANPTSASDSVTINVNPPPPPPPVAGGWSTWSPTTCPTACGLPAGTQTRTCTNPAPANGGAACVGSATSTCSATAACPVTPPPSTPPYIQTKEGDVHSNIKIEGSQP